MTCHTWIDTLLWETFSRPAWHWDWNKTLVMTKNTSIFVLAHCHYFLCFYLSSMLQSSFTSVYNEPVFQAKISIKHFIRWLFSTNCVHFQCWNEDWILALALVRTKMSGPGSEVDRRYCYKLINFCSFSVFGKLVDHQWLQQSSTQFPAQLSKTNFFLKCWKNWLKKMKNWRKKLVDWKWLKKNGWSSVVAAIFSTISSTTFQNYLLP